MENQNPPQKFYEMDAFDNEHKAWCEMFDIICDRFNVSSDDLNLKKYKDIFVKIERWAYFDRLRRNHLREKGSEWADDFGIFWNGE